LQNNINDRKTVPSSLVMDDANFLSLIKAYNELQLARDKRLMSQTPENPAIQIMDEQLRNLRQSLLSSIASIRRGVQTSIDQMGKYTSGFETQISAIPAKERQFLDFSRQQAIKQELYIFLLTKREETAVSKASNIAITQVVDAAKSESKAFKPTRLLILLGGFIIGILLPFGVSYSRQLLNDKVTSKADIERVTHAPILAEIAHSNTIGVFAVSRNSRTQIAERFRTMRTHLNYLLPLEKDKTILFTSCMGGEGKSFLSINLAQTLALANKKVLLMEMDLRKPKIREYLGLKKPGFSNFIVGKDNNWKQYIQKAGENNSFDVFSSGPVPPNPTELLLLPKMGELMLQLQKEYEYIIIDTAPVGLVTDAEILATYANLTLYVVRHNYTLKPRLQILDNIYRKKLLPKLNVLINDITYSTRTYGGYNNGYGYYGEDGYISENVEEEEKKQ
jgi:tyrosine-protein kinase Etk/Wzc